MTREATKKEKEELINHLENSNEVNLLSYIMKQEASLKNCLRCRTNIITIRSSWKPDLVKNPGSGNWGESKPISPFYAECKPCTFTGHNRGPERDSVEEAIKAWNEIKSTEEML